MNPTTLQAIGLMAGIAGSEKLHDSLKQSAANSLKILLEFVAKDIEKMKPAYSSLIN